jgi:hypothetical protein
VESAPGLPANNSVADQVAAMLKGDHRPPGPGAEVAGGIPVKRSLKLLHGGAAVARDQELGRGDGARPVGSMLKRSFVRRDAERAGARGGGRRRGGWGSRE